MAYPLIFADILFGADRDQKDELEVMYNYKTEASEGRCLIKGSFSTSGHHLRQLEVFVATSEGEWSKTKALIFLVEKKGRRKIRLGLEDGVLEIDLSSRKYMVNMSRC